MCLKPGQPVAKLLHKDTAVKKLANVAICDVPAVHVRMVRIIVALAAAEVLTPRHINLAAPCPFAVLPPAGFHLYA